MASVALNQDNTGEHSILVKKWFKNYHLVSGVKEGHESTKHTCQQIRNYVVAEEWAPARPSLAPVVIAISLSGSSDRPKIGEYIVTSAFLRRSRPLFEY
jgi:hypothetical protein